MINLLIIAFVLTMVLPIITVADGAHCRPKYAPKRYVNQIIYRNVHTGDRHEVLYESTKFMAPRVKVLTGMESRYFTLS